MNTFTLLLQCTVLQIHVMMGTLWSLLLFVYIFENVMPVNVKMQNKMRGVLLRCSVIWKATFSFAGILQIVFIIA